MTLKKGLPKGAKTAKAIGKAPNAPKMSSVVDPALTLEADRTRTIFRFFVPGLEDVGPGDSRAGGVVDRILALDERAVVAALRELDEHLVDRRNRMHEMFLEHAGQVASRLGPGAILSRNRRLLLGAAFTHEYSIEGAALCNPSAVAWLERPDGSMSFVLSLRGVGEGHISSLGFLEGLISLSGEVALQSRGQFPAIGRVSGGTHHRASLHVALAALGDDRENAAHLLDHLPATFDDDAIRQRLALLSGEAVTRRHTVATAANVRDLTNRAHRIDFDPNSDLSERVVWPVADAERRGIEDARFVRFVDDCGAVTYYATYTAFDGVNISQQMMETKEFASFETSPIAGAAAIGKGLALFPRRIDGRFVALSRSDRETNSVAFSDDIRCWPTSEPLQTPERAWEILQLGNCGSPIETERGWLVLTHGVGAMRTYSIGVLLLDLDDPRRVIARSDLPILKPSSTSRGGYVPNVVYSCGGFAFRDTLVVPYGVNDQSIAIATFSLGKLLDSLSPS